MSFQAARAWKDVFGSTGSNGASVSNALYVDVNGKPSGTTTTIIVTLLIVVVRVLVVVVVVVVVFLNVVVVVIIIVDVIINGKPSH